MTHSAHCSYHIWVVPLSRACHRLQDVLVGHKPVQDEQHTDPQVLDVEEVAPEVTALSHFFVVHLWDRARPSHTGPRATGVLEIEVLRRNKVVVRSSALRGHVHFLLHLPPCSGSPTFCSCTVEWGSVGCLYVVPVTLRPWAS